MTDLGDAESTRERHQREGPSYRQSECGSQSVSRHNAAVVAISDYYANTNQLRLVHVHHVIKQSARISSERVLHRS
jgi:hypothetical protein